MLAKHAMLKSMLVFFLTLFSLSSFAQNVVTGTVLDPDSKPVPGATIKAKGSKHTSVTGPDGKFSLSLPATVNDLEISTVGYESRTVSISGKSSVNIILTRQAANLNEVVVVGYGTQRRKDLTGAISSVSAATIEKVPVVSIDQALQGRAAGVQVTNNDGAPGGNISVMIRGTGSLASGGNNPLYVVDGYPLDGGINNINPSDIATIDVLKDASATAIYGIRAANGVVIVTTKKGRRDGVQISVDAFNAFQGEPRKYKILNAQQFATLANEVAAADPQQNFKVFDAWKNPSSLTNVDWQDALYRTGLTQNYSVALRGGSDKVQTATSFGYFGQKGIVEGSYFKRFTLGLNLDYAPNKFIKSSTSVKYSNQNSNNPFGTGSLVQLSELPPTLDGGNQLTNQISDGNGNYGFYNPIYTYVAKYSNPLYGIKNNEYRNLNNYLLASTSLEVNVLNGLRLKTNAGVNISQYNGAFYQPEDKRLVNQYGSQAGASQNAFASQRLNQSFEWVWENTASYDKTFGDHTIRLLAGISAQKNTYTQTGGQGIPPNSVIRDLSSILTCN